MTQKNLYQRNNLELD